MTRIALRGFADCVPKNVAMASSAGMVAETAAGWLPDPTVRGAWRSQSARREAGGLVGHTHDPALFFFDGVQARVKSHRRMSVDRHRKM